MEKVGNELDVVTAFAALLAGVGAILGGTAAFLGLRNRAALAEIHVLVNSKLDSALAKIAALEREAGSRDQRDFDREEGR